jgi:ADP-ribosylglycohydrolase
MIEERINRAKLSLDGLNIGDCFGESFFIGFAEFEDKTLSVEQLIRKRILAVSDWFWTDDSNMAFSVFKTLKLFGEINQDYLAQSFADYYETGRGYGPSMHQQLQSLRLGNNWKTIASSVFEGQGSWGNGSAMRVSPIGAYFADDLKKVCEEAEKSAVVTHKHEEAIVGAIAVAFATALAWKFKQENIRPTRQEFIEAILPYLANSEVRKGVSLAQNINETTSIINVAQMLGCGYKVSCPDTVPFCLFCAGEFLDNYEEAMWQTVSALGDRDTTCAIVGGIAVMYAGLESIPKTWLEKREPIPTWV